MSSPDPWYAREGEPRSLRVAVNELNLHLLEWGEPSARAVLMVHGMRGHARWFTPVGPAVGERFRALAVDLRGHGESDHSPGATPLTFVEDVVRLPAALGLDRPVLLGHSMGGSVALRAALELGDRIAGLVLVDSGLGVQVPEWQRWLWRLRYGLRLGRPPVAPRRNPRPPRVYATRHEAMARFKLRPGGTVASPELLAHLAEHAIRELPEGGFTWRFDPALGPGAGRGLRRAGELARMARSRRLEPARLRCPVVLIYGTESPITARSDPRHLPRLFRRARWTALEMIEGAHHHVFLDKPDEFNARLTPYLERMDQEVQRLDREA